MRTAIHLFFLLNLLMLTSCSKDLLTPLKADEIAVVESYLYAGDSIISVTVSKVLPFSDDTLDAIEYISGLSLEINGQPMTETETGLYQLNLGAGRVKPGDTYKLEFCYYSDSVTSSTTIPEKPVNLSISDSYVYTDRITSSSTGFGGPMEDIDLTWDNEDAAYFYVNVEYLEDSLDYINENMADLDLPVFQSMSPIQSSGTRLGMQNFRFFGHYRIVLFRVNSDYANLYQHITANSNNITNPATAIKNGYGVFTGMSTDTVYFEVKEN